MIFLDKRSKLLQDQNDWFWHLRRPLQIFTDLFILGAAFFAAYMPALNIRLESFDPEISITKVSFVVLIEFITLYLFGIYSIIWRYISLSDLKPFLASAIVSASVLLVLRFGLGFTPFNIWQVPISVILIQTVLGYGGLLAVRLARRFVYERFQRSDYPKHQRKLPTRRVLLAGAGSIGASLAREIAHNADSALEILGFLDDDPRKIGGRVSGFKVLGRTDELPRFASELNIEEIIITLNGSDSSTIRKVAELAAKNGLHTRIVPSLTDLAEGRHKIDRVRELKIEDLLGRPPVLLDLSGIEKILSGKTILVTGAGGSIGSELVRQLTAFSPNKILLLERSEFALFEIDRELKEFDSKIEFIPLLADINDHKRLDFIFSNYLPEIIFHAAAHKHVPLMETNAIEAVRNNIFGTLSVAEIAGRFNAERFVLISTDKAINPSSVMGATKRISELIIQELNDRYQTRFCAVRFGNVIGSAGSVIPIFTEQIKRGGPVTVTDPEMRRYFMTIKEAAQLVIQASSIGKGGEIFLLDMGKPVKILDLAEDMIRLSGFQPYQDIDIVFTGIRPGEKLFEELETSGNKLLPTEHPKIFLDRIPRLSSAEIANLIASFNKALSAQSDTEIKKLFSEYLPESGFSYRQNHLPEIAAETIFDLLNNDKINTKKAGQARFAQSD
ncbi:MAG TPA: nucleoside-diphosphate sugar epimerase/dehydratase [Pyrinomonadaceae bacterium]|nr:nucleoside-diphosphate sugar epimerase/dehydratase [Pyrinomonadaceae bacterium]